MRKRAFWAFFVLIAFFSFSLAYFLYGLQPVTSAEVSDQSLAKVKVERGDGLKEISAVLSQKNLIRSVTAFKLYALMSGRAHQFKPGIYELSPALSAPTIVKQLVSGRAEGMTLTIPEGATMKEIDRLLTAAGVLKTGELLHYSPGEISKNYPFGKQVAAGLEGFLFPDSYRLSFGSPPQAILKKFLDNFEAKAWPLLKDHPQWYSVLIKASLLEKEVPDFNDRRLVSGVIDKRLKDSVPLQVDATLVYKKCGGDFAGCPEVLLGKSDFEDDSPYNTYKFTGLPPTPIANPGVEAIKAALNPRTSVYWYYLSDRRTQKTYFSRTLEEHNFYRAKYLGI